MNYYDEQLNADKLFQVYDTAIPRIQQYLEAEIEFVREKLKKDDDVLELGAGYGRIMRQLAPACRSIVGVDISENSAKLGQEYLKDQPNASFIVMDVHHLSFDRLFDVVVCLQNGLSSMRIDYDTIEEIVQLLTPGGRAYFSTYSADFWEYRLRWFEEQADKGLLGKIDYSKTKNGEIVCLDGFKATTHSPEELTKIANRLGYPFELIEVDASSLFLVVTKP